MQQHLCTVLEPVGAVDHYRLAKLEASGDRDVVGIAGAEGHFAYAHGLVRVDHVHVSAGSPALHAGLRNEGRAVQRVEQQHYVDELLRKQTLVIVGKHRLQADGAGGGVDLTVDRLQGAGGELMRVASVPGSHRQG